LHFVAKRLQDSNVTSNAPPPIDRVSDRVLVEVARSLRRHVDCPPQSVEPGSLRQVLDAALAAAPPLASYVFDDQRAIRKHVAVFVNGEMVPDRVLLDRPLRAGDRVLVIQALTGG
jgi:molybdopterin synthase sulfur carrier subunit